MAPARMDSNEGIDLISPISDTIEFMQEDDVVVYLGEHEGTRQPDTFQCCPLGVQLYVPQPVSECEIMELKFSIPTPVGDPLEVACTGIVAQCMPCPNGRPLHRIWVKFLDLRPELQERIREITTGRHLTCPFCQNF